MAKQYRKQVKKVLQDNNMWKIPVNVIELAEKEKFAVLQADMSGDGRIVVSQEEFEFAGNRHTRLILINKNISNGRKIFTVAHELAHWYLEGKDGGESFFAYRDDSITEIRETNINGFASELLMPTELLTDFLRDRINDVTNFVGLVANNFNVSKEAAQVRLDVLFREDLK